MKLLNSQNLKVSIVLSFFFIFVACDVVEEAANYDTLFDVDEQRVIADSATYELADSQVLLLEQIIHINIDSLATKVEIKKIEAARFDFIRIQADIPDNSNLNWLAQISATVTGEGIAETEVGSYDGTKPDARIIDLNLNNAPLTPYLLQETFVLKIYASVSTPLPADTTSILINSRIRITIQPL